MLEKRFKRAYDHTEDSIKAFLGSCMQLYNSPEVQGLAVFEQHLQINRLQHITAVAYITSVLCKRFGLDEKSALRGAVMHDLFYYDWREGDTGRWHRLHGYRHPRFSMLNARELCPDITKKEEYIILRHMWPLTPLPPVSKEGFAVTLADKYCATLELLYSFGWISADFLSEKHDLDCKKSIMKGKPPGLA